jgi:signal transduction histidine kinase/CheY-like chemotaxis protein
MIPPDDHPSDRTNAWPSDRRGVQQAEPGAGEIEQAFDLTNRRTLGHLKRGLAFQVVFIPVMLISASLMHGEVGPALTGAWVAVYALFLIWPLALDIIDKTGRDTTRIRTRVGQCNAALLGVLAPLTVNTVSQTHFMALTLLMMIILVFLGYGYVNMPRILHGYLLMLFTPFAICWFLSSYELSWVMGATLVLLIAGSFRGAVVARLDTRERLQWQLANESLASSLALKVQDLDRLNRSKTSLLAAACHDLRQPAHAMGLLIDAALVSPEVNLRSHLLTLQHGNGVLVGMLSTLMDLTRLDSGSLEAVRVPVSLAAVLGDARLQFQLAAVQKGLGLNIAQSDLHVFSDPYLLRRVLFNLLSNAIKYTSRGSVSVTVKQGGEHVVLSVTDTGVGIPAERQASVFDEYTRLERTGEGLGIGLSVVKRACALMAHGLTLRSAPGVGTTVSLTLDLSRAAAPDASGHNAALLPPRPGMPQGARPLVVMAEDDENSRRAVTLLLESWNYDVVSSSGLLQLMRAIEVCGRQPAMLMTDLHLNDANGFEIASAVRGLPGLSDLPTVMITGDLDPGVQVRAREDNLLLLHKPMPSGRLREVIRTLLSARDPVSRAGC